jgi:uncharacterized tellurite resistance protein B-like protein
MASMFVALKRLLDTPAPQRPSDVRLSVAVLLLEAAQQDDTFDPSERTVIEKILTERFQLSPPECAQLIAAAQTRVRDMVQIHGHTSDIAQAMSPEERIGLIEMLWEVAYADGVLDAEEDHLIRRIAKLVYVEDRERVHARLRVLERTQKNRS